MLGILTIMPPKCAIMLLIILGNQGDYHESKSYDCSVSHGCKLPSLALTTTLEYCSSSDQEYTLLLLHQLPVPVFL